MKIMVAAVASSSEMSGVQRHAFNAVRCLLLRPEISAVHLVVAPWQRKLLQSAGLDLSCKSSSIAGNRLTTHLAEMDRGSISRNLWYYRDLPLLAEQQKVDLVHFAYPVPVNSSAFACPTVVTLHDLYPYEVPSNFGWRQVLFNRIILQQCLRRVDAIACVSQITSLRLQQYAPQSTWQKSVRIYNCVETNCVELPLQQRTVAPIPAWEDEPFLLCVAQHRRNKNIPLLIRTLALLLQTRQVDSQMKLMIVGIAGPETHRIHRQIARSAVSGRVHLLEGISEAELQWCYRRCAALVAPSSTEGFGLPVAEGLLAGCRIVCTDIPAFREISDGHCRFVPLSRRMDEPLAAVIAEALREPAPPPVPLPLFSAPVLAAQYLSLYRELVTSTPSQPSSLGASIPSSLQRAVSERRPG